MSDSYNSIDSQTLDVIKWPPSSSPSIVYGTNPNSILNNLHNLQVQASYRYVYDDKEKSCLSPYSKVAIPQLEELSNGSYITETPLNNYLKVGLKWGHETVDKIECFVRFGNTRDWQKYETKDKPTITTCYFRFDNTTKAKFEVTNTITNLLKFSDLKIGMKFHVPWDAGTLPPGFLYDFIIIDLNPNTLEVTLDSPMYVGVDQLCTLDLENVYSIFRNDVLLEGAAQDDLTRPFDYVPQLADTQEIIDGNKIIYGGITEGYDAVPIDVALSVTNQYAPGLEISSVYSFLVTSEAIGSDNVHKVFFTQNIGFTDAYILSVTTDWSTHIGTIIYDGTSTVSQIINDFVSLVDEWRIDDPYIKIPLPQPDNVDLHIADSSTLHTVTAIRVGASNKHKVLSWGAKHNFGIIYYDAPNRSGAVNKSDLSLLSIPYYNESSFMLSGASFYAPDMVNTVGWSIRNLPPVWATHYQWAYGGCDKKIILQTVINGYKNSNADIKKANGREQIYINRNINDWITSNSKVVIPAYAFEKGDRIRFIAYKTSSSVDFTSFTSAYIDKEIIGINYDVDTGLTPSTSNYLMDTSIAETGGKPSFIKDANGNKMRNPTGMYLEVDPLNMEYPTGSTTEQLLVEIYRPTPLVNVWKEFGECYEIGNPGTSTAYHKGLTQDQDPANPITTPAKGTFDFGNVYLKPRYIGTTVFPALDQNMSDFFISDSTDVGRANLVDINIKQQKLKELRFGGSWYADTNINNVSTFWYQDFLKLEERFGDISGIQQTGFVLKVLQPTKETSIYIGRLETFNQDGIKNLIATKDTLGTVRPDTTNYGTPWGQSIIQYQGSLYFADPNAGLMFRDAGGGQIPINTVKQAKMKHFFLDAFKKFRVSGLDNILCQAFIYYKYGMVCWQFVDTITPANSFVIGFNPESDRWISFYSHYDSNGNFPEFYGNMMQNTLVSFLSGAMWLHESEDVNRCTFYGTKYPAITEVTANQLPHDVKTFEGIEIDSDGRWAAPYLDSIKIDKDEQNKYGMQSRLKAGYLKLQEGMYRSDFLRDALTTGRVMRIITSWTNTAKPYDTFTLAANPVNLTALVKTGTTNEALICTNAIAFQPLDLLAMTIALTLTSGTAPILYIGNSSGVRYSDYFQLRSGNNVIRIALPSTFVAGNYYIFMHNNGSEAFSGSFTISEYLIVRPKEMDLFTGRKLRGHTIQIRLENTDDTESILQAVDVHSNKAR